MRVVAGLWGVKGEDGGGCTPAVKASFVKELGLTN